MAYYPDQHDYEVSMAEAMSNISIPGLDDFNILQTENNKLVKNIKILTKALEGYADPDNWGEANGGSACNIYKDLESVYFNGYDEARNALQAVKGE